MRHAAAVAALGGALAAALVGALVAAAPAAAHVVAQPDYVTQGEIDSISLEAPNERDVSMTGFVVHVPSGIVLVHAHEPKAPWKVTFADRTAVWSGGSLAPGDSAAFGLVLEAKEQPGPTRLQAEQLYGDGSVVRWTVALTVLPASSTSSSALQLVAVIGLIGLLVVVALALLVWRARGRSADAGVGESVGAGDVAARTGDDEDADREEAEGGDGREE